MSNCRIERKRAHDREAQRQSRAKTKAYIAHLEKTVADLSESSGDNRANYLAKHASTQAQEIEILQGALGKIKSLVQDVVKSDPVRGVPALEAGSPEDTKQLSDRQHQLNWDSSSEDQGQAGRNSERRESDACQPPRLPGPTRNLHVLGVNLQCDDKDDTSYYGRVNAILEKVERTPDNMSNYTDDQDIIIRAIIHGWDAAERVHHFDIGWHMIRAFDEGLWWRSRQLERFANFWTLRTVLLNKLNPHNQDRRPMPTFLNPTPRQTTVIPHPAVADYFSWPDIRDFVIMMGTPQISGRATIAFAESFRFLWPYELRDVYVKNSSTDMHELSERFLKHFNDLSCYRIAPETLSRYEPRIGWGTLGSSSESSGQSNPVEDQSAEYHVHPAPDSHEVPSQGPPPDHIPPPTQEWPFSYDLNHDPRLLLEYAMDPMAMNHNTRYSQWPVL